MNEAQNSELIKGMYAAFAQGNIQTILDNLTDDVEWNMEAPEIIPFSGKRTGKTQVLGFFRALSGTLTGMKLSTDRVVAQGDQVATLGRFSATVTATGKKFDTAVAHFFTITNGKASRFEDLTDTAAVADAYRPAAGR